MQAAKGGNVQVADDPEVNDQYAFFVLELYPPLRRADYQSQSDERVESERRVRMHILTRFAMGCG